jgi:hypothetical protein
MTQKLIIKKTEIQKNLKQLINHNAWYSTNFSQTIHVQNILSTKHTNI